MNIFVGAMKHTVCCVLGHELFFRKPIASFCKLMLCIRSLDDFHFIRLTRLTSHIILQFEPLTVLRFFILQMLLSASHMLGMS